MLPISAPYFSYSVGPKYFRNREIERGGFETESSHYCPGGWEASPQGCFGDSDHVPVMILMDDSNEGSYYAGALKSPSDCEGVEKPWLPAALSPCFPVCLLSWGN